MRRSWGPLPIRGGGGGGGEELGKEELPQRTLRPARDLGHHRDRGRNPQATLWNGRHEATAQRPTHPNDESVPALKNQEISRMFVFLTLLEISEDLVVLGSHPRTGTHGVLRA